MSAGYTPGAVMGAIINQPWEDVADDVTGAIEKAVQPLLKKATDSIYEGLLDATQDYLKDNLAFNIAERISAAERQADHDRRAAAELRTVNDSLLTELRGARTALSLTRTNIMVEIGKSAGAAYRWEGVPELLKARLDRIDALLAKATGQEGGAL